MSLSLILLNHHHHLSQSSPLCCYVASPVQCCPVVLACQSLSVVVVGLFQSEVHVVTVVSRPSVPALRLLLLGEDRFSLGRSSRAWGLNTRQSLTPVKDSE